MATENQRIFLPFRLDPANAQLWRNDEEIVLRRKAFDVLRYLVDHPGQLVTKAALLDAVWGDVAVGDTMPAICVGELRRALGDEAKTPQFIETVHGRGYRFIAKITTAAAAHMGTKLPAPQLTPAPIVVGRDYELTQLRGWFAKVIEETRNVVFVSGEPGIGKSTFVTAFLANVASNSMARIGRGQCIEQYGAGEPYMPVLEALTRLGQEPDRERLGEILRRLAPAWLAQMPSLLTEAETERSQATRPGVTQQRMLREMVQALEALSAEAPLVLLLEDLHWSDFSTLELIAAIARRTEPARLMILGTYRPVAMLASDHPLRTMKEELELHQHCHELRLKLLSEADVANYLSRRFANDEAAQFRDLAPAIYQRSEGNPLFMVNVVNYLVAQGPVTDASKIEAPRNIRQMIERNLERLTPDEQQVLEGASMAGAEFSAAAVAAGLERPVSEVEACCTRLSRREQFIAACGASEWPDGTHATAYRFVHTLYQQVLYHRAPLACQTEVHRMIAQREEAAYGAHATEIAAELAYHYGCCGDKSKTLNYLEMAGQRALGRRAFREAEQHYRDALEILQTLPESPDRDARELPLQVELGGIMQGTRGWSAADTGAAYSRARFLAERTKNAEPLEIFAGLWSATNLRGELRSALALADQMVAIARSIGTPAALVAAHTAQGYTRYLLGDLVVANEHLVQAIKMRRSLPESRTYHRTGEPLVFAGQIAWHLGYPDKAARYLDDAVSLSRRLNNPFAVGHSLWFRANVYGLRRDFKRARADNDEALRLSAASGFPLLNAIVEIFDAWTRANMGETGSAVERIRKGLVELNNLNFYGTRAKYLGYLCETQILAGAIDDAIVTVEEALQANPDERIYRPEMLRLRGELKLASEPHGRAHFGLAEKDFREAIEIARTQSAKSWELRATTSLARLLAKQGHREQARAMLAEIYKWFTEGFDTTDLKEARVLLEELHAPSSLST
jgi:DNA-binding winged helix-turn-helix (wHTH) protein/tetratricopeptide (TPR) repeat protein